MVVVLLTMEQGMPQSVGFKDYYGARGSTHGKHAPLLLRCVPQISLSQAGRLVTSCPECLAGPVTAQQALGGMQLLVQHLASRRETWGAESSSRAWHQAVEVSCRHPELLRAGIARAANFDAASSFT